MSRLLDYYRVQKIADELQKLGIVNPGVRQICEGLRAQGIRHSAPSVYKHLEKWRSRALRSTGPSTQPIPSELPEDPRGFVCIRVGALVSLQQEIVQLRTQAGDLADAGEALQTQIDDLQAQVKVLESEQRRLSYGYDLLTETNERLRHEAHCEREEAVQARIQLACNEYSEEHYTRRLAMQQVDLDRLEGLLRKERQRALAAEIKQADLESANRHLSAQVEWREQSAERTCATLRQRADSLQEQLRSAQIEVGQLRWEAQFIRDQLAFERAQVDKLMRSQSDTTKLAEEVSVDALPRKPN